MQSCMRTIDAPPRPRACGGLCRVVVRQVRSRRGEGARRGVADSRACSASKHASATIRPMLHGLMMDYPLTLSTIFRRAEQVFPKQEIVWRVADRSIRRHSFAEFADRA